MQKLGGSTSFIISFKLYFKLPSILYVNCKTYFSITWLEYLVKVLAVREVKNLHWIEWDNGQEHIKGGRECSSPQSHGIAYHRFKCRNENKWPHIIIRNSKWLQEWSGGGGGGVKIKDKSSWANIHIGHHSSEYACTWTNTNYS